MLLLSLTFMVILLAVLLGFSYYILQSQGEVTVQRKPLVGSRGYGYTDTEFAEELSFDLKEPEYHIPQTYDDADSKAVLLVKDPHWLHAYWEIGTDTRRTFRNELHEPDAWDKMTPNLRVYDTTSQNVKHAPYFDIPIHDDATSWYIKVGKPNHSFVMEVGRMRGEHFYPLVRSNQVTTPSATVSNVIDPNWPPHQAVWENLSQCMVARPEGSAHLTSTKEH